MPVATADANLPARGPAWKWWVCGLLLLATMLNYMDRLTLNQMAKRIKDGLLLSNEQYGQVEGAFGVAFALGALAFGWTVDRWNARWVYALALLAWSAAGFITGFAQTFVGLLLCRFLLGLFEAGNWPCALRTTQRILLPRQRTLGNSILQSGAAIGAVVTPLLVLFFVTGAGSRWLSVLLTGSHGQARPEHLALFGFVPQAGFPGQVPWPALFLSGQDNSWRHPFFVIGAIGTLWVVLWLVSVRRQDLALTPAAGGLPSVAPLPETTAGHDTLAAIYRDPRFGVLIVLVVTINLTWHFFRVWLPLFLREQHDYSEEAVNYFTSAYYLATDAGSLTAGFATLYLAHRGLTIHASRVLVFLGCSLLTTLSVAVAFLDSGPLLLGLLLLLGFGALGLFPVYYSLSQELTVRHQGMVTGTLGCSTWLASAVMHPLVGRWIDRTKDYSSAVAIAGLFPLAGLLALLFVWKAPP